MKLNRTLLPLTLALIAACAATGCHRKGTVKVTDVHHPAPIETAPTPQPDYNTKPFNANEAAPTTVPTTPVVTANTPTATFDLKDFTQDPAALAAYTVHFPFDSATVQANDEGNIGSVAQALKSDANAKLLIEGHCDERGTEEYNRALGERRALAVREALGKGDIDPMRVKTVSFGKDKPEDPAHDEAAWAKNRRAVFILLHPKTTAQ